VHVALIREKRGVYRVLVGTPTVREHLEDVGVDGMLVVSWILRKWDGGMDWIDLAEDGNR